MRHFPPTWLFFSEDDRNWLARQLKACKKQDKVLRAGESDIDYQGDAPEYGAIYSVYFEWDPVTL